MKYTIHVNQRAVYRNAEHFTGIGYKEFAILEWMLKFSHSPKIQKKIHEETQYYWFDYQTIMKELPLLFAPVGSDRQPKKDIAYRKVKKLVEVGVLVPHPENAGRGKSYYAFGEKCMLLVDANYELESPDLSSEKLGNISELKEKNSEEKTNLKEELGNISELKGRNSEKNPNSLYIRKDPTQYINPTQEEDTTQEEAAPSNYGELKVKYWESDFKAVVERINERPIMWGNQARFYAHNIFYHIREILKNERKAKGMPNFGVKDAAVINEATWFFDHMPTWVKEKNYFSLKFVYERFDSLYAEAKQKQNGSTSNTTTADESEFDKELKKRLAGLSSQLDCTRRKRD